MNTLEMVNDDEWLAHMQDLQEWIEQGMKPRSNIRFTAGKKRDIAYLCEYIKEVADKW
jgi:hypothetical protein